MVAPLVTDVPGRGVIARGLGRSYGDPAQNAGGRVIDMSAAAGVRSFDPDTGRIVAEAGLSLDALLALVVPFGWFVPVTPGTRQVTLGGAIAADVHGKNHHQDGTFAADVMAIELATPTGPHTIGPDRDPSLFWATVGGMGLTGVITAVELQLLAIRTSRLRVDTERAADLDDLMTRMSHGDDDYRYSVAWIDLMARGASLGRSVLTRGHHAEPDDLAALDRATALAYGPSVVAGAPPWVPSGLLNRATVRAFNELWFRKAPRHRTGELQTIGAFFHPLDAVSGWNRIYGARGFLQYQFVVPFGAEETLRTIVGRLSAAQVPTFLAVLKRFGPANDGHLSFPRPGWTLALDVPAGVPGLEALLRDFDRRVVEAAGRLYLAKDSRMAAALVPAMYPRLDEWREVRDRVDPQRRLTSDLDRRLALTGGRP
jgi:decaprenylphospho-beta-D-ribofuranose 2-oxidase